MKIKKNSLIFSVTYENYKKNIVSDKENKTLGAWKIPVNTTKILQYAYVYLTNSNKTIVKKYEIENFERNNPTKGYEDEDKQCFIFKKSEDVFFEYPGEVVQGRHYQNNEEMDKLPKLEKKEIEKRLYSSQNYKNSSEKKNKSNDSPKEFLRKQLVRIMENEYSHKPKIPLEAANKIISTAYEDPDQDLSALFDEYYIELDNKNNE